MLLEGQTAIVTGGGRGIGRAIALRFAKEGAAVVVAARTASELQAVASEISRTGGQAAAVAADVSQEADCERMVATAREKLGAVHILVNNAGIHGPLATTEAVTPQQWDEVMALNLRGPFLLMRLVLPEMCQRGSGVVVNISSISAKVSFGWNAPYAASKAGLLALTRVAAAEVATKGVRVNAICPGPVFETRMSQELGQTIAEKLGVDPETQRTQFLEHVLQRRPQTADEIAAAAVFLASGEASAITGQALNVDGGMVFY